MKKNDILNKIIIIFLFLQPFIDVITAFQTRNYPDLITIGTIFRGLFFVFCIAWLSINKKNVKQLTIFAIYLIFEVINLFSYDNNFFLEISNIFRIFYLPILIGFFSNYSNEQIDDKFIYKIYIIYLNFIIIPYIFGFGHSLSEIYPEKEGFIGMFYGGNEISAVLVCLFPVVLNYIKNNKINTLSIITIIELLICMCLVGTKVLILGILITIIYFIFKYIKENYYKLKSKTKIFIFTLPIMILLVSILIFPKTAVYDNLNTALEFYEVDSINEFLTLDNFNKIILSDRGSTLVDINEIYKSSNFIVKIYGLGLTTILSEKMIEIDFFDILYSIGIFGLIIWIYLIFSFNRINKLNGIYKFSVILMVIISFFSGHILITPMVSLYLAIMYILNKNANKELL